MAKKSALSKLNWDDPTSEPIIQEEAAPQFQEELAAFPQQPKSVAPAPAEEVSQEPVAQPSKPTVKQEKKKGFFSQTLAPAKKTSSPLGKLGVTEDIPATIENITQEVEAGETPNYYFPEEPVKPVKEKMPLFPKREPKEKPPKQPKPPKPPKEKKKKDKPVKEPREKRLLFKNQPASIQLGDEITNGNTVYSEVSSNYTSMEMELEMQDELASRKERAAEQRHQLWVQFSTIALIIGCVYLIFLIYGTLNTQYVYNDEGHIVPQRMTVQKIQALEEFDTIATEYLQARLLYEEVLTLDYRIGAGIEDPLLIAPEYEAMLNRINDLIIQTQAVTVSSQYAQVHEMLQTWIKTEISVYCQNMSTAIAQNNATAASHALEYKQYMYNDFSTITANLTALGSVVDGADIGEIANWSPESYVSEHIGALEGGF